MIRPMFTRSATCLGLLAALVSSQAVALPASGEESGESRARGGFVPPLPCAQPGFAAPAAFQGNIGVWEGSTFSYDAEGKQVLAFNQKLEIAVDGARYFQRNTYMFPDGKVDMHAFPGVFTCDGKLHIETERISLWSVAVTDEVLFNQAKHRTLGEVISETVTLIGEDARIRTNQRSVDGKMLGVFFMNETRTSRTGPDME